MAKFFYRMQNILDIKYKLEDTAKQEYANARRILNIEEDKLSAMRYRKDEYEELYSSLLLGELDFQKIQETVNAIYIFNIKIEEQTEVVRKKSKELEKARAKLKQVMQERKMHEKLKEKQFEEFVQEINDQEKKETDQVVSYQYNKGKDKSEG